MNPFKEPSEYDQGMAPPKPSSYARQQVQRASSNQSAAASYQTNPFKELTSGYLGTPPAQPNPRQTVQLIKSTSLVTGTEQTHCQPYRNSSSDYPPASSSNTNNWMDDLFATTNMPALASGLQQPAPGSSAVPNWPNTQPTYATNPQAGYMIGFEDNAFQVLPATTNFPHAMASTTSQPTSHHTTNPFDETDAWHINATAAPTSSPPYTSPPLPSAGQWTNFQASADFGVVDDVFGLLPSRPTAVSQPVYQAPPLHSHHNSSAPLRRPPPPSYSSVSDAEAPRRDSMSFQPLRDAAEQLHTNATPLKQPTRAPPTPPRDQSPTTTTRGFGFPRLQLNQARRPDSPSAGTTFKTNATTEAAPMCLDVRLPPLRPASGSHGLKLVAAINGALLAAPIQKQSGAMLQWVVEGSHLTAPKDAPAQEQEQDSAPCGELRYSGEACDEVSCLYADDLLGCVWAGHADGRVSCWRCPGSPGAALRPLHIFQAHRLSKVAALTVSAWGDVFTASASGTIRVWSYPSATIDRQPPVRVEEMRRRSGGKAHAQVVGLALGASGRVLWSAGKSSLCLWDVCERSHLGTVKDARSGAGLAGDEEVEEAGEWTDGQRSLFSSKRLEDVVVDPAKGLEPSQRPRNFTARSPPELGQVSKEDDEGNAAVQRYTEKLGKLARIGVKWGKKKLGQVVQNMEKSTEQGGEDRPTTRYGSIKSLLATPLGTVWVAYKRGLLECFNEWGKLLMAKDMAGGVGPLVAVGSQVWAGGRDGNIFVFSPAGDLLRSWSGHMFPVRSLAAAGSLVFSLSSCGAIRAWSALPIPQDVAAAWQADLRSALIPHRHRLLAGTWNVGEGKPNVDSLRRWLAEPAVKADMVVVGLQEIEMGTTSVARDAAYSYFQRSQLEQGNAVAKSWAEAVAEAIGAPFQRLALRKLSGMLLLVFARSTLAGHCGEISTASVACGFRGIGGNKGAVAVSLSMYRRLVVLVASHFAAHQEAVEERCENYRKIVARLKFGDGTAASSTSVTPMSPGSTQDGEGEGPGSAEDEAELVGPGMSEAELLLWMGDFNFRINQPYEKVTAAVAAGRTSALLPHDQLLIARDAGRVFTGLSEAPLTFPPTYKFEKGEAWEPERPPYDRSEKRRVPAWTDRILYRGSNGGEASERVTVQALSYNAAMKVTDSDHKPVWSELEVTLPAYQQLLKRELDLAKLRAAATADVGGSPRPPRLSLSQQQLHLVVDSSATLTLTNNGEAPCAYVVGGDGAPDARLPYWACVQPCRGLLAPGKSVHLEVSVASPEGRYMGRSTRQADLRIWAGPERLRGSSTWQRMHNQKDLTIQLTMTGH